VWQTRQHSRSAITVLGTDITERKKAEETLLAKEHELASIYASVPEVLFFLSVKSDCDFRFLSVSQSFLQVTGLNEHQVVGKSVQEVIPEPSLSLVFEKYAQAIRERKSVKWEEVTDYPSGRKYGEVTATPFFDSSGRCTNLIGSVYDITKRKKDEEALRKQASIIDLSIDAIIVKKLDDTITFWSNGAQTLYGWTKEDAVGQKSRLLFKTKFSEPYEEILEQLKSKGRWSGEKIHQTKSCRTIIVDSRWLATRDLQGEIGEIVETNVDITERKKMEQELSNSLKESRQSESEISALLKASRTVLKNKEFPDSARAIFDACKELLGATAGYVALLSDDGKEM